MLVRVLIVHTPQMRSILDLPVTFNPVCRSERFDQAASWYLSGEASILKEFSCLLVGMEMRTQLKN